jgi:hypothetical protein
MDSNKLDIHMSVHCNIITDFNNLTYPFKTTKLYTTTCSCSTVVPNNAIYHIKQDNKTLCISHSPLCTL